MICIANSLLRTCCHAIAIPLGHTTSPAVEDLLRYMKGNKGSALLARVAAWTIHELDDLCKLYFMPLWKKSLERECNILKETIRDYDVLFSGNTEWLKAIDTMMKGLSEMDVWTVGLWLCQAKAQRFECFIRLLELPLIPAVVHYYIQRSLLAEIERIPALEDFCVKFHKSLFWDGKPKKLEAVDDSVAKWVRSKNPQLAERLSARRFKLQNSLLQDLLFEGFKLSKKIQVRISQEQVGFDAQLSKLELMLEQEQQTFVNTYLTAEKLLEIAKDITGPQASQSVASLRIIEFIRERKPISEFQTSEKGEQPFGRHFQMMVRAEASTK